MRIAVAQIASTTDPAQNLELVRNYARRAADAGARLVVFPEATMASFATKSAGVAEPLDGPFASRVREIAREAGLTIALGLFTPGENEDRPHNTLLVTGGGVEEAYHKLHLFDVEGFAESDHITSGDHPVLIALDDLVVGLTVCYDVRFPELFKHYADAGAHVVLVPSSWQDGDGKVDQFRTLVVARALDSACYIVAPDQAAPEASGVDEMSRAPLGVGHSLVVGPQGKVLAEAGAAPDLLVVDVAPQVVEDARAKMPVLANSRFTSRLAR